jgi:hypothetical protein
MNIKSKNRMVDVRGVRKSVPLKVTLTGLLALSFAAKAQQVIMPAISFPVTPPAV